MDVYPSDSLLFVKYPGDVWKDTREELERKFKGDKERIKRRLERERSRLQKEHTFDFLLNGADIYSHRHLPVAAAYCRRLGLVDFVNKMVQGEMGLQPGRVVQAMVLDTLSERSPLYRLEDFIGDQDIELLLGTAVNPAAFNDTNLARSLDAIFEDRPSKIVSAIGVRATQEFALDTKTVSYDTTSISVWGDYRACENDDPPEGPVITYGHSKDKLPHLKQFMTELLCVDRGVPIFSKTLDDNSSVIRKAGRPPLDRAAPTTIRYVLSWELAENTEAIEREKLIAGCFVLLTNVPISGNGAVDSRKLLLTYKGQYGVESDFAFLKDPLIVNDTFLKNPIESMRSA